MHRATLIAIILVSTSISWAQASRGESPASKDDIEKLLVAMQMQQRIQVLRDESRRQSKAFLTDYLMKQVPGAAQKGEQVKAMTDEMLDGIFKDYPINAVLQDIVPIYQKHLTTSDVDALIAFYSTPVGKKVLHELPIILSEIAEATQSRLRPRLEEAAARLTERLTKMVEQEGESKSK